MSKIILYLSFIILLNYVTGNFTMPNNENAQVKPTFRYFGYGSNLLAKRIQIQNPTAVRVGPGLLKVIMKIINL